MVSPFLQALLSSSRTLLFSHCESTEEGTRNVVAECLGKLTLVDPLRLLPQLKVCVNSQALGISDSVYTAPEKFENVALLLQLGPTGYSYPSRKRSFSKTVFKQVEFENVGFSVFMFVWETC